MKIDSRGNRKNGRFLGTREQIVSSVSSIDRIKKEESARNLYIFERYQQRHDNRIIANEAKNRKTSSRIDVCARVCVCGGGGGHVCICVRVHVYV